MSAALNPDFSLWATRPRGGNYILNLVLGLEEVRLPLDFGRRVELAGGVTCLSQENLPSEPSSDNQQFSCSFTFLDLRAQQVLLHVKTKSADTLEGARGFMFRQGRDGGQEVHPFILRGRQIQEVARGSIPSAFKNFIISYRPRDLSNAVAYRSADADPVPYTEHLSREVLALVESRNDFLEGMDHQLSVDLSCSLATGRIESAWFTDHMTDDGQKSLTRFPFGFSGLLPGELLSEWVISETGTYGGDGRMR